MANRGERADDARREDEASPRERRASGTHARVRTGGEVEEARLDASTPPATTPLRVVHSSAAPTRPVDPARAVGATGKADAAARAASAQRAAAFASRVLRAARDLADGADRALIEHVWRHGFHEVLLEDFKQLLFATHKRGLLVLGRADLRSHRYPRADLDASEIARSSLRFHFIRTVVPGRAAPR